MISFKILTKCYKYKIGLFKMFLYSKHKIIPFKMMSIRLISYNLELKLNIPTSYGGQTGTALTKV